MNEKCDLFLNDILEEALVCFGEIKRNYYRTQNVREYIENLGKLTNVLMSIKTGLVLSTPPMYVGSFSDSTDCKRES